MTNPSITKQLPCASCGNDVLGYGCRLVGSMVTYSISCDCGNKIEITKLSGEHDIDHWSCLIEKWNTRVEVKK